MSWSVVVTPPARRDFRRLDPQIRWRIEAALRRVGEDPYAAQLKSLTGRPGALRLRVGDWRVILRLDDQARQIVVLRVAPRGRAYRD